MKIALPIDGGEINAHFGRSTAFAIVEAENGEVKDINEITTVELQHNHEGLATVLLRQGVNVAIVGGIGPGALEALEQAGIKVIGGACGQVKDVVQQYLNGTLEAKRVVCNHDHHDHHHGNGGCHGGGCHS